MHSRTYKNTQNRIKKYNLKKRISKYLLYISNKNGVQHIIDCQQQVLE